MKNKKWSLEVALLSGVGVNQVKIGEVMGDFKDEDTEYFNEVVRGLIEKGETKEYKENVVLKLGEFEGATKEEAYENYFDSFTGDDYNELFFMNQVEAIELAVPCGCGGNCGKDITDDFKEVKFEVTNEEALSSAISRGEIIVNEKVTIWKDSCYRLKEGATSETVLDDLKSGKWREWDYSSKDVCSYIDETEDVIGTSGTLELYTANGSKIGGN